MINTKKIEQNPGDTLVASFYQHIGKIYR